MKPHPRVRRTAGLGRLAAGAVMAAVCASCSGPTTARVRPPVTVPEGPINDHGDYYRGRYNRVYGDANQTIFVTTPSEFLMDCVRGLAREKGREAPTAVDLGAGQGRNSIPLAEAGYLVTAIDLSAVGLAHLRAQAESRHLTIETLEADVFSATFEPEALDLVVAIYFGFREDFFERLQKATKPGGAIVIEGYPGDAQPGDVPLPDRFPGWKIVRYERTEVVPDWYWRGERKPVPVVRFFARKPGPS